MAIFIPGLELSELFYTEVVRPILEMRFPDLVYSAALIGPGSEVLGYDTPMSMDYDWGPRLQLFVSEPAYSAYRSQIIDTLSRTLPYAFRGFSTHFSGPNEKDTSVMEEIRTGPVNHRVEVYTIASFFEGYLGFDPRRKISSETWLTVPEQKLLTIVSGKVFHDALGDLEHIRVKLSYYPENIWFTKLAAQWTKINQLMPMARRGSINDEITSRLVAAQLVHALIWMCFLIEKRYAPVSKWFGTAFSRLVCAEKLAKLFNHVLSSNSGQEREHYLGLAYTVVAQMYEALGITPPIPLQTVKKD